ncbi:tRNA dimethylallyltransferase [bacterium BMS3Bbin11]|nr:tRNA dimethylallyltransferase [bacterium BMS3Abin11]GBE46824.1 tRNA dimethylallyltransferase [bacterium BMS3Bbin11]GMT39717.1 MAG: tRNA dimethylallyltransferase [bacterium]HDH16438.1 tRNA (adenosine(37)-N6)-dimethylallyltransferase MiaA [Gammaproteobacteria bacterium]HDZ78568.1 tRNA (adenosine(37)-N6)-dimethylallyltransferase MiaA [Gammaproteobacteria bacterium]
MGPTAAGKTGMAMRIADTLPVGLISVDSGQVYRGMDIGTAKITAKEMMDYPHALIDIREPSEPYSADEFRTDASQLMNDFQVQGRVPLLVGGTMFYFRALQYGLPDLPAADEAVREKLLLEAKEDGWQALHDRLSEIDPESAVRINPNDRQRIQRALEIYQLSGVTPTQHVRNSMQEIPWKIIKIGIWPSVRTLLHENIEKRLSQMFEQGFLDEVRVLQAQGLDSSLPAMRTVGYRQVLEHLDGKTSYEEMRLRCLYSTRQLAKRQLTWLRNDPGLKWFDSKDEDYPEKVLEFIRKKTSV